MKTLSMWLGIAALIASQANAADERDLARLDAASRLWQGVQSGDYEYRYQKFCECYQGDPPTTVVEVRNGRVDRVYHLHGDSDREVPARDGSDDLYWTVEDLFSKLRTAYSKDATVRVEYDPSRGYPVSLFIDYDASFTGDETDLRLTGFERF